MVNDEPHYTGKITTMKKSLLLITAVLALLSASCGSPSNTLSEDVSAESHEEIEVSLPELKQKQYEQTDSPYTLPEFKEYIAPEYDLSEYSPLGTEGATKIIVHTEDIGGTEFNDTMLKSIPNVGDITDIYFEEGITLIGGTIGNLCPKLKSVRLPNTLKTLGLNGKGSIFADCAELEEIYIPKGVTAIPTDCFANCKSLKNVWLCEGLELISTTAFYGCDSLTEIKLPESLKHIGRSALPLTSSKDKPGIRFLVLPDNMEDYWGLDGVAIFVTKNSAVHRYMRQHQDINLDTVIVYK